MNEPISDAMRDEITEKIHTLAKDHARDKDNRVKLEAQLDALALVYKLDKRDLQLIAETALQSTLNDRAEKRRLWPWVVFGGITVSLIVLGILAWVLLMPAKTPSPTPVVQGHVAPPVLNAAPNAAPNHRGLVQRALLSQVMANLTPIRLMFTEYYMATGEYPTALAQLGLKREEMATADHIDDIRFNNDGVLIVKLSKDIDQAAYLNLNMQTTMGGLQSKWHCTTNLPQTVLGVAATALCQHSEDIVRME